jgi:phosphoglycerate transport regulatory protein PgtC
LGAISTYLRGFGFGGRWAGRSLGGLLLAPLLSLSPGLPAIAQELRILTSMPATLFAPFAEEFERQTPGVTVNVLNKNTNAGVEEIVRGNPRGFDIFWVSSAEAFAVLNAHDAFARDTKGREDWRPDPRGGAAFYPFALSSIGWAQMQESAVPRPSEWDDLLRPVYAGRIAMTRPSRSGTTHMFVERFLQVRGWEGGWSYLLALSGNLSTLTSRSFGVIDGVEKRRFDIGISIDFLAMSRADSGLTFRYGRPVMVMPAQIGILRGGQSPDIAARFVALVLSPQGQEILLRPEIRRVPINAQVRANAGRFAPEIESALRLNWQPYDALLARDRYWAVNALFDVFVTFQLAERQDAWRRLRALAQVGNAAVVARVPDVERLLTLMPVSEALAITRGVNDVPTRVTAFSAPTASQQDILARWRIEATSTMARAVALLDDLERQAGIRE